MSAAHYLGIDVGGTLAKAAVFDAQGRELAVACVPMHDRHPRAGWTERDPQAMWAAAVKAVRQVLQTPGVKASGIAAVCCTGHGNGVYPVSADGQPAMPGIVSSDNRAEGICHEFEQRADHAQLVAGFGQRFRACSMPVLLAWIDRHAPESRDRIASLLFCKDYLRLRLTGEAASELSDVSGSGILNFDRRDYDEVLLDRLGLLHWRGKLPRVLKSSAIAGRVTSEAAAATGLVAGTPVAAGMMDVDAVTLASGVLDDTQIAVCGGTWSINLVLRRTPCAGQYPLLQTWHRDGEFCVVCEGSPTSASNLAWALKEAMCQETPDYQKVNAMVAELDAGDSTLVYLPYIHGADGMPKAAFIGLDSASRQAHLLRAVYEGVAFEHARHIADVIALSGATARTIRLSGGVSQSDVWAQMLADVTGIRVEVAHGKELGALGSAICAAVAVGHQPDYASAVKAMARLARSFEPSPERVGVYRSKRMRYERIRDALAPEWPGFGSDGCRGLGNEGDPIHKSGSAM